jgi:hypothetical protein
VLLGFQIRQDGRAVEFGAHILGVEEAEQDHFIAGEAEGLSLSLSSLTVSGPAAIAASVTVTAAQGTVAGSYVIAITATGAGSGGTVTQTSSITVVVTGLFHSFSVGADAYDH